MRAARLQLLPDTFEVRQCGGTSAKTLQRLGVLEVEGGGN